MSKTSKAPLVLVCLSFCLCFALLAAGASAAGALSIGAAGNGAGEFTEPQGIAISQEAGEAVIVDHNNARVDAFATSGPFLRAFGWGVQSAREELQTCTASCFPGFEGPGAGELIFPEGIAVDNDPSSSSHGDLYVWDRGNLRVQKYAPSGEFLLMFGGEVNANALSPHPNLCLAGEDCKAGVEGPGPGELLLTVGNPIAVDPASGTVYVGDQNRVQKFSSAGTEIGEVKLAGAGSIEQLAIDSAKDLYVKSSELAGVRKYSPTGTELEAPRDETGSPGAIAIGPSNTLLVADQGSGHIMQYSENGVQLRSFGAGSGFEGSRGIAYDTAENAVFVLSSTAVNVVPIPPAGPLVVGQSTEEVKPASVTLTAIVNPEGPEGTTGTASYRFEYGPSATYGHGTATTTLTGEEFEDQDASAAIAGLEAGKTYHFHVVVTNGAGETSFGPDQTVTTLPPVTIDRESASKVTANSARLEGELNPHGLPTEYHFEYGPCTSTSACSSGPYTNSVPLSDASAGEGTEDAVFAVPIQSLTSATTYHYRLVAHNGFGESTGPDQTFTTKGASATALIDGRAWEMVTPLQKHGATIEAIAKEGDVIQAAADGHALTYAAGSPITSEPQGNRSVANSQVLSSRAGPGAWSSQDIATKHEALAGLHPGEPSEYQQFSSNLESAIVEPHGATPLSEAASERTPYRREADGSFTPLVTAANVPPGVKFQGEEENPGGFIYGVKFIAATPDDSHVLVSSPQPLSAGASFVENTAQNIYEWENGSLRLASVLPTEAPASSEGGVELERSAFLVRHALSDTGDRVVFAARERHLYLRDMTLGKSVQLDAPEAGLREEGDDEAFFQTADASDSRIFFLSAARLTVDSTARGGEPDLYECEVTSANDVLGCRLKDLTVDTNLGESAHVLGTVLGADETGSYVYFVANGRLAAGAVSGNCPTGEEGASETSCNLYARDTVTGATRLVAVLSGADFRDWLALQADLGALTSRVSPNGQYLAFMSERPLTGFDNRDAKSGQRDQEVYEYSYAQNTLTCVSCASSGTRPEGVFDLGELKFPGLLVDLPQLWQGRWLAASVPGWTRVEVGVARYQSRYLSNSGRMFFNSATPLVPSDGNGLEDVYEYEPSGAGSCGLSTGCVGLISSGGSSEESAFMDASEDGSDVFFLTSAELTKSDTDNSYDVYDAHVCSSESPCGAEAAATPPPCGTADACRAASAPLGGRESDLGAPATQTFSGAGNQGSAVKPTVKVKAKPLTRAQKLAKALKVCRGKQSRRKRAGCEASARKRFGPTKKAKTKARK